MIGQSAGPFLMPIVVQCRREQFAAEDRGFVHDQTCAMIKSQSGTDLRLEIQFYAKSAIPRRGRRGRRWELQASEAADASAESPGRYDKATTRCGSSNSPRLPPNLEGSLLSSTIEKLHGVSFLSSGKLSAGC